MSYQEYQQKRSNIAGVYASVMDPDAVACWASEKDYVGAPNSSFMCPLAQFLDDMTKDIDLKWTVSDGKARCMMGTFESPGQEYALPNWATISADLVDDLVCEKITRDQFLLILDQAQQAASE